jgi:hypothetical protein
MWKGFCLGLFLLLSLVQVAAYSGSYTPTTSLITADDSSFWINIKSFKCQDKTYGVNYPKYFKLTVNDLNGNLVWTATQTDTSTLGSAYGDVAFFVYADDFTKGKGFYKLTIDCTNNANKEAAVTHTVYYAPEAYNAQKSYDGIVCERSGYRCKKNDICVEYPTMEHLGFGRAISCKLGKGSVLSGKVTDKAGKPVAGATVKVTFGTKVTGAYPGGKTRDIGKTDSNGAYTCPQCWLNDDYKVEASKSGYAKSISFYLGSAKSNADITLPMTQSSTTTPAVPKGTVVVNVTEKTAAGKVIPLKDATACLFHEGGPSAGCEFSAQSGSDGKATISGLPDRNYVGAVSGPGLFYNSISFTAAISGDQGVAVSVTLYKPNITATGQFWAGKTGTPLSNVTVCLNATKCAVSGADGKFSIPNIASGDYILTARHTYYYGTTSAAYPSVSYPTIKDIVLKKAPVVTAKMTAFIESGSNSLGVISGAKVCILGKCAISDDKGVATILGIPSIQGQKIKVTATKDGYANGSKEMDFGISVVNSVRSDGIGLKFLLSAYAGTAVDAYSNPLSGVSVCAKNCAKTPCSQKCAKSVASGAFSLNELTPGTYIIAVTKGGYLAVTSTETLQSGQMLKKTHMLLKLGTFTATIVDQDNKPVAGAKFCADEYCATSDSSGKAYLKELPVGDYAATVTMVSYASAVAEITVPYDGTGAATVKITAAKKVWSVSAPKMTPATASKDVNVRFEVTAPSAVSCELSLWNPGGCVRGICSGTFLPLMTMSKTSNANVWYANYKPTATGNWEAKGVCKFLDGQTIYGAAKTVVVEEFEEMPVS